MTQHTFRAEPDSLEIVSTYIFEAPRERVYAAYNNPELIPKWWGPEGSPLHIDEMDVRVGGSWRFVMREEGNEFAFRGVYHEAVAPEKLIYTWQYEDAPTVALVTTTFEEVGEGMTKLTEQLVFQSVQDRQAMLDTGMSEGSLPMLERLARLV